MKGQGVGLVRKRAQESLTKVWSRKKSLSAQYLKKERKKMDWSELQQALLCLSTELADRMRWNSNLLKYMQSLGIKKLLNITHLCLPLCTIHDQTKKIQDTSTFMLKPYKHFFSLFFYIIFFSFFCFFLFLDLIFQLTRKKCFIQKIKTILVK